MYEMQLLLATEISSLLRSDSESPFQDCVFHDWSNQCKLGTY